MTVAPEQALVRQGFAREDLFVAVHEQFMTETAAMADIVLPATMFMEHDDLYYGGGHQHISVGAKLIDPPGECRSNHEVLQGLGRRLNAVHPGFEMTPRELIDATLKKSGHGDIETPGSGSVARYPAGFSHFALSRRLRARRQEIPLQGRLGESAVGQCRAWVPGPRCRRCPTTGRSSRRRMRHIRSGSPPPLAQLSQHQFQRNAVDRKPARASLR